TDDDRSVSEGSGAPCRDGKRSFPVELDPGFSSFVPGSVGDPLFVLADGYLDRIYKTQGISVASIETFAEDSPALERRGNYAQHTSHLVDETDFRLVQRQTEVGK